MGASRLDVRHVPRFGRGSDHEGALGDGTRVGGETGVQVVSCLLWVCVVPFGGGGVLVCESSSVPTPRLVPFALRVDDLVDTRGRVLGPCSEI